MFDGGEDEADGGTGLAALTEAFGGVEAKAAHFGFGMAGVTVLDEDGADTTFEKDNGILTEGRDPECRECEKQTHG